MKDNEKIGGRIKALRERIAMTKSELARQSGVSTTAVWNWEEHGRVARGETLEKAAKALGVSQLYLVTGEEKHRVAPPTVSTNGARTVAVIIEDARTEIANITGVPLSNVRLNVEFVSQ
jgi:transcriptional regulator with XRE-family HTH domain